MRSLPGIILAAIIVAALYLAASTHTAPELWPGGATGEWVQAQRAEHPANVPAFTEATAREFPGCQPLDGEATATVLVVTLDGETRRMGFDTAYRLANDANWANDVWTVGTC